MPPGLHEILARGVTPDPEQRWPDMRTLLLALEQVRRPTTRRWPWAAGGLAAIFLLGLFVATRPAQADECEESPNGLATVWNEDIALELRGVMGTRKGSDALTSWAARWVAVRARECERDKQAGETPEPSLCMESARDRFRATVTTLRTPHLRAGMRFARVINELPAPEHCLDHPDNSAHGRGGLLELHTLDAELGVLIRNDNLEHARRQQTEYMELARTSLSSYDITRAIFWRGELRRLSGELDTARQDFDLALEQAKAIGAEEFAAEVTMKLAAIAGAQGHTGAVEAYAHSARVGFAASNPDRIPEVLLVHGAGLLAGDGASRARAIELLREAVALREDQYGRYGGSQEPIGRAVEALARALLEVGDLDLAIEATERSLAIHIASFGGSTSQAGELRRLLFVGLIASGREREAEEAMWAVLSPLQLDQDYAAYFEQIQWFVDHALERGAANFARDWSMRARQEALQVGLSAPPTADSTGP